MHALLSKQRFRKDMATPHLTNLCAVLQGKRYKRGMAEARGRKCTYTRSNVLRANPARKVLIKKANNDREVHWQDIRKKSRVSEGHRSTLLKAFRLNKFPSRPVARAKSRNAHPNTRLNGTESQRDLRPSRRTST